MPRKPRRNATPVTLPLDVRLMTGTANFLFVVAAFAFAGLALSWLMRLPAFSLRAIRVDGEVTRSSEQVIRNAAIDHARPAEVGLATAIRLFLLAEAQRPRLDRPAEAD